MKYEKNEQECDCVSSILRKYEFAKADRQNWDTHWEEIAKYVNPKKNDIYGMKAKGEKRGQELLDATAIHSNELLASALHSMLTNPSIPWFSLTTGSDELDDKDDVRKWIQLVVRRMHNIFNNSNFQTEVHEKYLDECSLGTSCFFIEEDENDIVRFQTRTIYEMYIMENNKSVVDEIYRKFKWTIKQIIEEWGEDILTEDLRFKYRNNPTEEFEIIHAVCPRKEGKNYGEAKSPKEYKFASYYILLSNKLLLEESGYHEFPATVVRWTKLAGEVYGRSPAMKALPDIKMLNKMMEVTIKASQISIAPPVAVPDDGFILPIKLQPFGINFYRSGTRDEIKPLLQNINVNLGLDMIKEVRTRIQQAFFIDQLQLQQGPQMTATEVTQRTEEQLRLLGPILGRQHNEFLKPLIDRVYKIMLRRKLLPPAPIEIQGKNISVVYSSQVAKTQRTSEAVNIQRAFSVLGPLASAQPEMLDMLDGDTLVRYAFKTFGAPQEILRDTKNVKKIRDGRMQAQAQQAQMAQEQHEAEQMKAAAPMMQATQE